MYWIDGGPHGILPIRPLDLLYGNAVECGDRPLMSHRTGFTGHTLAWWLAQAGFDGGVEQVERLGCRELVARVHKNGREPRRVDPGQHLVLVNHEGAPPTMEDSKSPTEPTPDDDTPVEHQGPGSQVGASDHATVEVQPPADETDDDDA